MFFKIVEKSGRSIAWGQTDDGLRSICARDDISAEWGETPLTKYHRSMLVYARIVTEGARYFVARDCDVK
jgi:hypothetical protein